MGKKDYIIFTNNPKVYKKYNESHNVTYMDIAYLEVLKEVRKKIHEGHLLLSHPLSGSVKPNETPYKSIMISKEAGKADYDSLMIIESAIQTCSKFEFKSDKYKPQVYGDFQDIDLTLIESGMESADLW